MEAKAASGVKVLVLSSPHNPTGRVWTRQELEGVAEICLRHNIFMLVDEIHCDFMCRRSILTPPLACWARRYCAIPWSATPPTRGFNLGGLGMATLVLADDDLRCKFNEEMSIAQTRLDNIFGMAALIAAYNDGEEWLDQAIAYVSGQQGVSGAVPAGAHSSDPHDPSEGTYLVWLDCSPAALPRHGPGALHDQRSQGGVLRRL